MKIVSTKEFRDNQKKYLEMVDNGIDVIIHRTQDKAYLITAIGEKDRLSVNPDLIKKIFASEKEILEGKTTKIKNPEEIWESIL